MILEGGLWSVMKSLKFDEMIALRTASDSFWRKIMPRARAYRPEQFEFPVTENMKMVIDRHDYSQWRIFAGGLRINPTIFEYVRVDPFSFTMLDIGANVGGFTTLFAREIDVENFNVHLFEANPLITQNLDENIKRLERSNLMVNATINHFALGESNTRLPLKVNERHSGTSAFGHSKHRHSHSVDVDVRTIDTYCKQHPFEYIDLIRIDQEAFEPSVLKGGLETLSHYKPAIYFKFSRDWFMNFSEAYLSTLFSFLNSIGYFFLREGKDGKFHYLVLNENTLRQYQNLNILGMVRYELRARP